MYYNDLHSFDLSSVQWVALDLGSGDPEADRAQGRPSPRTYLGLAATSTHLYLFGGWGGTGEPDFRAVPATTFIESNSTLAGFFLALLTHQKSI